MNDSKGNINCSYLLIRVSYGCLTEIRGDCLRGARLLELELEPKQTEDEPTALDSL